MLRFRRYVATSWIFLGWIGEPGKGRALGVSTVKFTGEVLKNIKMATYNIDIKRILKKEGAVVGLADGILEADGKKIYVAENLKVGLLNNEKSGYNRFRCGLLFGQ